MERTILVFKGFKDGIGKCGHLVSNIVNYILLLIVFIFGIGIVSIISRINKKEYLELEQDKNMKTYWKNKVIGTGKKEDYIKPF